MTMAWARDSDSNEREIKLFANNLEKLQKVENFAESYQSFYQNTKWSSSVSYDDNDFVKEFKNIRDKTRDDALVFFNIHLKITKNFLQRIEHFFAQFEDLTYEEWREQFNHSLDDVKKNEGNARVFVKLCEKLLAGVKDRKMQTESLLEKIKLEDVYEKDIKNFKNEADSFRTKWYSTDFFVLESYYEFRENRCLKKADALQVMKNKWLQEYPLGETTELMNTLNNFIASVNGIATFFSLVQRDTEKCITARNSTRERKLKSQYERMKEKGKVINYHIKRFFLSMNQCNFINEITVRYPQNYVNYWFDSTLNEAVAETQMISKMDFLALLLGIK